MILVPDYYKRFKCIADRCQDSCCIGWEIDVDPVTIRKYRDMGDGGREMLRSINLDADPPHIRLCEDGRCPHLDGAGLCRIISKYGEEYIPDICKNHPRYINAVPPHRECGLGLACPEAARIILAVSECPRLEAWGVVDTKSAKTEDLWDEFPTNNKDGQKYTETSPTNAKLELLSLRERLFFFIFDKNHTVSEIISGLCACDNRLSDCLFDMQAGLVTEIPEVNAADFSHLSPLIALIPRAIASVELLSEDYRRGFAEPSVALISERLVLFGDRARGLLYYFVHRYFLERLQDLDIGMRLSLAVMLLLLYLLHTEDFDEMSYCESAVAFSKNIEYSTENIDILLDIISENA